MGILNCIRVLMENEIVVFPRQKVNEPLSSTERAQ
jgi:hypothetical protein